MLKARPLTYFTIIVSMLVCSMAFTSRNLISKIRFGLEFRGGYEIYYTVSPKEGKAQVTSEDLLATANILRKRADSIGMAEPEIHLEGKDHIRLKMAGLTSLKDRRSSLGDSSGLPTILTEKYTQTVGSVLGKTALKETMTAGAIGIVCIFLLLLFIYRGVGILASFSTIVYLWLLTVFFNSIHATLSLSAVVAFVLGIGVAADASIICFERIREELAKGEDLSQAVRKGFNGSFSTIRDANFVTILAMLALFIAGIGPIQGFSLTMLASIIISITTNFFLARILCVMLADSKLISNAFFIGSKSTSGIKKRWSFDFVGIGRKAAFVSILIIVIGAWHYHSHHLNLDIDFTAGTALDIDVNQPIDQLTAAKIMADAGTVPATVSIGGKNNQHIAVRFDEILKPNELQKIISAFQAKYGNIVYEENTADPGVARDFAIKAIYAILAACLSILIYIGIRFSWSAALAIIASIIHDILIVSAIFAIFKFEIDVTYIAALLTIMGYSLNDKIVIFGRIRENAAQKPVTNHIDVVNLSIRQTLGRSIYTVLTVILAAVSLLLFACEPLQMFSLAILLGLVTGAYSSIFLTSPLWLILHNTGAARHKTEFSRFKTTDRIVHATVGTLAITGVFLFVTMLNSHRQTPAQIINPARVSLTAPLGDLSPFKKIALDALHIVESGDLPKAKARVKDLETAWDNAEEKLRAANAESWTAVDKAIDRALTQLRSGKPDPKACVAVLKTLIAKCKSLSSE